MKKPNEKQKTATATIAGSEIAVFRKATSSYRNALRT